MGKRTRQIWWMCSGDHVGCTDGHVFNTREETLALIRKINKQHRKRHPQCQPKTMHAAARRDTLLEEKGRLNWPGETPESFKFDNPAYNEIRQEAEAQT